jgi:predicted AAA+ superfamily ATPase
MREILKSIILDFQEAELETGVPRRLNIESVPGKATVCIGVRRAGKSTYLFQRIRSLLENGVPPENILYLNFFDDRLHNLEREGLGLITEAYFSLYPEKKNTEQIFCFFDEIQVIDGWESFVDRLMRTEKCEVYLTGSSAQMLSKEIATQMRGRALPWEVFPFSFREYLDSIGLEADQPFSTKRRLLIEKAFGGYWESGGFPEVLHLDSHLRIKIHQEYFHAVLFRDLVERHDVSHPRAVVDLAHRLVDTVASMFTINRMTGYLKSLGHSAPKSSVSNYMSWFEDAYFLFTVRLFDASMHRRQTNPKKIYCIDHSLVNSVASGILVNRGHLLENLVFTTLRRIAQEIHYYKTSTGLEVDFIAKPSDQPRMLVQVCDSMSDLKTKTREITSLTQAMAELDMSRGIIVTRHEEETIKVESGTIEVVPIWRFLLEFSTS